MDLKLRYIKRSPLAYSQHQVLILQQWNGKEWVDVPVVDESYPLPDGRTGNTRDWYNKARVKRFG